MGFPVNKGLKVMQPHINYINLCNICIYLTKAAVNLFVDLVVNLVVGLL